MGCESPKLISPPTVCEAWCVKYSDYTGNFSHLFKENETFRRQFKKEITGKGDFLGRLQRN